MTSNLHERDMFMIPYVILAITDEEDRSFMEQLFLQYRYIMFATANSIVCNMQDAEEIVSNACVSLIGRLPTLRELEQYKLRSYIVYTVRNSSIDYIRQKSRHSKHFYLSDVEQVLDTVIDEDIVEDLIRRAESSALRHALHKLTTTDHDILQMKYFDQMKDAEIAEHLHIATNSVRYYLTRARRSLRKALEEDQWHE